jgi:hypothetical protein
MTFTGVIRIMVASLALATIPATAHAQSWFLSPFLGSNMGGDTTASSPSVGVSGGWLTRGWLGAEADLAWSPTFYEQDGFLTERRALTFMGNAIVAWPGERKVRPLISGGVGLFSSKLSEPAGAFAVDADVFGWNVGGGVMAVSHNVGVRGDVRYFRAAGSDDKDVNAFGIKFSEYGFWRVSVGLAVRF